MCILSTALKTTHYIGVQLTLPSFLLEKEVKMTKKETDFAHDVLKPRLEMEFPGILIVKQDPNTSFQGIPDHLLLFEDKWAALETKRGRKSARQPNQEHHVGRMDEMSYAAFVHPDNLEEVVHDLQQTFRSGR